MSPLIYQSNNNYWIQQQYYYQMGGIFLSQDINGATGVTNIVSPLISIYNVSNTASVVIVTSPVKWRGIHRGRRKCTREFPSSGTAADVSLKLPSKLRG